MDKRWTRPSTIPPKLYRILCPNQHTHYDPANGLMAPLTLPSQCWIPSSKLRIFFRSIEMHRDQVPVSSPYISLFESLEEAESWCIAAEDYHRTECYILEINMTHEEMKSVVAWFVHDIQVMCPEGVQLGMGPKQGLMGPKVHGGRFDSEWLALYYVPGIAMKTLKSSSQCRDARAWQDDNMLAAYGGGRLPETFEALDDTVGVLSQRPVVVEWEDCTVCPNAQACFHVGGWRGIPPGLEDLGHPECVPLGEDLQNALEQAKLGKAEGAKGGGRVGRLK